MNDLLKDLFLALGMGFVGGLLLSPGVAHLGRRMGVMDFPEEGRRIHANGTPRTGGLAILLAFMLSALLLLGSASFSKYLMYRDLEPESWPEERPLDRHPIVSGLLSDGLRGDPAIWSDEDNVDDILHPRDMFHVVDADSSQPSKTSDAALSNSRSRSRSPEKEWKPETPKRSGSVEY